MTSGDPNIALRGKMTEILLNVPIESCSVLLDIFKKSDGQELQIKNNNVFNLNLMYSICLIFKYV